MTRSKNQTKLKTAKLEAKIAACRRRLMDLWDARGRTDPEVLATGIELDKLLNEYQRLNPLSVKPVK
ncbi:MAG: Spo0E family sporulation regulatory protein-aspartic acid phosphatase [Bacillota bacterium]